MRHGLAHMLTRLYPRPWRERYGGEFEALLESNEQDVIGTLANVLSSALRERIRPTAISIDEPIAASNRFESWCIRVPWIPFALVPVAFLAVAWFLALLILWSGWKIFLPAADSPFLPTRGVAEMCYFNVGRALYLGAPVLVGWGTAFIAARRSHGAAWPAIGLALIALFGGTAQVHAGRTAVPGWPGHININLAFGSCAYGIPDGILRALVILMLSVVPLFLWRPQRTRRSLP